jgi:hypothetical protein
MISIIYQTETKDIEKILDVHRQGGKILCPVCNSDLLILDTWESATIHKKHPGIYCLTDEKHVFSLFHLADRHDEVWRRLEQWKAEHETK